MISDLLDIVAQYIDPKTYLCLMELDKRYTSQKYETLVRNYRKKMSSYHWMISFNQITLSIKKKEEKIALKSKILETLDQVNEFHILKIESTIINDKNFLCYFGIISKNNFGFPNKSYIKIIRDDNPSPIEFKFSLCTNYGTEYLSHITYIKFNNLDYLWKSLLSNLEIQD